MTAGAVPPSAPMSATTISDASLPFATRLAIITRLFAIQSSWNYEIMIGNGIGFCVEPALRLLPGGKGGEAYRDALARQSRYFNAHPYLSSFAVGALARAELEQQPPARIERFRTALCPPLGSVGDRLVWVGLLPNCSFAALFLFGVGASPLVCVLVFLLLYNAGHVALRLWGLQMGCEKGLAVASALAHPILREGPVWLAGAQRNAPRRSRCTADGDATCRWRRVAAHGHHAADCGGRCRCAGVVPWSRRRMATRFARRVCRACPLPSPSCLSALSKF